MKLVIPAAGQGSRLRPHTYSSPKTLVHVAGKAILDYLLEPLLKIPEVSELVFVVGNNEKRIREHMSSNYAFNTNYVCQSEATGLAMAIWLTREKINGDAMLIALDDGVIDFDPKIISELDRTSIGVQEVDNPSEFGIVETDGEFISRLIEKPENPSTNLAIAGIYYIKNSLLLFECIEHLIKNDLRTRGEYQLTDALQLMVDRGEEMRALEIDWIDCGKKDSLLNANRHFLSKMLQSERGLSTFAVIPPVFIADNALIENSVIGPYASIGDGATITDSIIRDSVINPNATIENRLLDRSIIGDSAYIHGEFDRLNVGDLSHVH